ncbi:ATP-binding protein [Vogesella sp. DC21W]|uniref:ATP-binding protein n=1 Tax=Vogesella aquatica TaxID=2984206 RepID=A0ABT5J1C8_9NEIS|nr:ATP-binding protein [Vogesella aquatica]MDC7718634.1 ATP-binding protein [Vogesella aquatica]
MSLELYFREACERHEHLKLLESQWRFDKELISKALQNISSIFPHYSRHDSSHSRQIIVNIERMLGDRIGHLTATDIWLILEAAYSHDIGMVVTYKQIQDMDTPEFKIFVQDIVNNPDHDLYQFSLNWLQGTATLPNGSAAHVFFDEYRQLLAEWYRKKHPENSAKIIHDPLEEIGLTSPRNELLPKRLFGVLAAICDAHGQSFEKVMELPFSEAGMATEDCHPRYVAFLLRMGDLLDVDDNRFCPVMMRMSGASLPEHSHAHFDKHQGIRHFRLDSERIEIEVVCPSPDSYEVAHDWFKWLEREYQNQSQHWPSIVPNKKLGRLPTLSPPRVYLNKPYLVINQGKKPNFDLNADAILKLLRGTGLYSSKIESVREILQNAVDSTIISIWEKHSEEIVNLDPSSQILFDIYDASKISVDFLQNHSDKDIFTLVVKDVGMGISRSDIVHMLQVGSSSKNSEKSRIIQKMPEWFKPSGNFGIGLQSIYLLSDKFSISTKSRVTNEALRLTFSKGKNSSVVIEILSPSDVDYGATVEVDIRIDPFPDRISIPFDGSGGELMRKMGEYDFTKPTSDLKIYEQIKIFEAIKNFNAGSPIKIKTMQGELSSGSRGTYFSRETNIALSQVQFGYFDFRMMHTLFRGQPFSDLQPGLPFVSAQVDFYGHQAIEFLTYNREKILPQAKSAAVKKIKQALIEYIFNNYDCIDEVDRPCAAAFYCLNSINCNDVDKFHDDLMRFDISIEGKGVFSLSEVLNKISNGSIEKMGVKERHASGFFQFENQINPNVEEVALILGDSAAVALKLIKILATKRGIYWQELLPAPGASETCLWSHSDICPVSNEVFSKLLSGKSNGLDIGRRMLFPSWGEYRNIAIEATIPWARFHMHISYASDYLVLPYVFSQDGGWLNFDDDLIGWVYERRKNKNIDIDEIRALYEKLNEEIGKILLGLPATPN